MAARCKTCDYWTQTSIQMGSCSVSEAVMGLEFAYGDKDRAVTAYTMKHSVCGEYKRRDDGRED